MFHFHSRRGKYNWLARIHKHHQSQAFLHLSLHLRGKFYIPIRVLKWVLLIFDKPKPPIFRDGPQSLFYVFATHLFLDITAVTEEVKPFKVGCKSFKPHLLSHQQNSMSRGHKRCLLLQIFSLKQLNLHSIAYKHHVSSMLFNWFNFHVMAD